MHLGVVPLALEFQQLSKVMPEAGFLSDVHCQYHALFVVV
jgi:hypothetical protein